MAPKKAIIAQPKIAKAGSEEFRPGQKYPRPKSTDPLARFYVSMYRQKKCQSPMAEKWCLEHGLFKVGKAMELDTRNKLEKLSVKKTK